MLEKLFETLTCLGGTKKNNSIYLIDTDLAIKHKKTGIKYTITRVGLINKKPAVLAYRYYDPKSKKKFFLYIKQNDFNKYEPV